MKCEPCKDERYPSLSLDRVGSKDQDGQGLVDVPPRLINALQKAEEALATAERDLLAHLEKTDQLPNPGWADWLAQLDQ
jgi:hypothetical protein